MYSRYQIKALLLALSLMGSVFVAGSARGTSLNGTIRGLGYTWSFNDDATGSAFTLKGSAISPIVNAQIITINDFLDQNGQQVNQIKGGYWEVGNFSVLLQSRVELNFVIFDAIDQVRYSVRHFRPPHPGESIGTYLTSANKVKIDSQPPALIGQQVVSTDGTSVPHGAIHDDRLIVVLRSDVGNAIPPYVLPSSRLVNWEFIATTRHRISEKPSPIPEPLTILGTGVVLGAIPVLKKEYAKRDKKKDKDA